EEIIKKNEGIIIKPGIVYGDKNLNGLINKISTFTEKYKIVPAFINLDSKIYLSHIEDLCKCVDQIIQNEKKGVFLCVNINSYTFKELINKFSKNKKIIVIPIIWQIVFIVIKIIEIFKFNVAFRSDSVLSLAKQNKNPKNGVSLTYTNLFRN
ncbi:hypothetical protein OAU87_05575, partial [Alphaproteobacteria bacterium]|nr:hypothetical protein [Alphaproteobacteria bacterium]